MKWPHTFVADSLAMGEAAVKMAKEGARAVTVLGVDFMSESVRGFYPVSTFIDSLTNIL